MTYGNAVGISERATIAIEDVMARVRNTREFADYLARHGLSEFPGLIVEEGEIVAWRRVLVNYASGEPFVVVHERTTVPMKPFDFRNYLVDDYLFFDPKAGPPEAIAVAEPEQEEVEEEGEGELVSDERREADERPIWCQKRTNAGKVCVRSEDYHDKTAKNHKPFTSMWHLLRHYASSIHEDVELPTPDDLEGDDLE